MMQGTSNTLRKRRPGGATTSAFDTSNINSPHAEREALCGLLDLIAAGRHDRLRELVADVDVGLFTVDCNTDIARAIKVAADEDREPTIGTVSLALRRDGEAQGIDRGQDDACGQLNHLAEGCIGTAGADARNVVEALIELRELHAKRAAMHIMQDATATMRDAHGPEELAALARRMSDAVDRMSTAHTLMQGRDRQRRRLRVRKASEIEPQPIEWVWHNRIAAGALTIVTGFPSASKSTLCCDIAARMSTGDMWPDQSGHAPRGGVLWLGSEDDPNKVIRPRLDAAHADLEMVRVIDGIEEDRKELLRTIIVERDLRLIEEQLDEFPECRAIIFDPLSEFIGGEENSNGQTRAALQPLVQLAQERNIAIIAIMHVNKKSDSMMLQRIAGASSYLQVARTVLVVGDDPDDEATGLDRRKVMIVGKSNYGPANVGQLYRVAKRSNDATAIEWMEGTIERNVETMNTRPGGISKEHQERRAGAVDTLRDLLAGGRMAAADVDAHMIEQGFKRRQITHAADTLDVDKRQEKGEDGRRVWYWSLPSPQPGSAPVGEYDVTNRSG